MDIPLPEQRRVKITSDIQSTKLQHLAASHPFTRQLDVVFPSSDVLESALASLKTRYSTGRVKLADVVDSTGAFADFFLQSERCFTMLSTDAHGDDVWCIDPRGLLTLLVSKDTYERLGLLGKTLPFKAHSDYFVIRLPLQKNAESAANRVRRNEALKAWDARREREGLGAWNVLYCSNDSSSLESALADTREREVQCQVAKYSDVFIPVPSLRRHPSTPRSTTSGSGSGHNGAPSAVGQQSQTLDDHDDLEDWNTEMAALFEWLANSCTASGRLRANDRVDPYVALYECPAPSRVGSVTHLRWSGFIAPAFLQSVIDLALASVKTLAPGVENQQQPFVAITAHAHSASPVAYIPTSARSGSSGAGAGGGPVRMARAEGEDTWCVFAMPGAADSHSLEWAMVESVGQYDTRWG
ncbi:hypothetical protein D9615_007397 [Tricholomella constricta]|uniref:Uncharacterized protein n=1 Tax=Tricholomella constricta TaxID=117010 RepID=A0A8H5GYE6_9AGAR|nr:hypothetical protein D9615_007397 [Tricholomella constricta]